MNRSILFSFTLALLLSSCDNQISELEQTQDLYESALKHNDLTTQRVALSRLILLDTSSMDYIDSLARLYIKDGNYEGGLLLAEQLFEQNKGDNKLKELSGVAYQQVFKLNKATEIFNSLFANTRDYRYAYQVVAIAYEQANTQLFDSLSNQLLNVAANDSMVARTMIDFPGPITGAPQLIPLEAATIFLKGKFALDKQQDIRSAVNYYQQAIVKFESFEMPYYYLQEIEMMQRQQR